MDAVCRRLQPAVRQGPRVMGVCPQGAPRLLDHLIHLQEDGWGNRQVKGLSGLEIEEQLELGGLLDGESREMLGIMAQLRYNGLDHSPATRTRRSSRMRVKLQLVLCSDEGQEETVTDVITLNKNHQRIEHLGLTLAEAKQLLSTLQQHLLRHCQLIEKIPNKWVKHLTADLLTPCIFVHECQGKSQEIGYLPLS